MRNRKRLLFSGGAVALVIGIGLIAVAALGAFGSGSGSASHRIILFSEAGGPAPALSDAAAIEAGFIVVHSKSELMDDVDSGTRAIVVTATQLGQLDQDWIHGQYAAGMVVGAINVPAADWANIVGGTVAGSPPATEWPKPYVSIASGVDCPSGSRGSRGMGSSPVDDAMQLATMIDFDISLNDRAC